MDIKIRPAQESDSPAVEALISQITQFHHAIRPDIFRSDHAGDRVDLGETADTMIFVAIDECENIVGCIWCIVMRMRNNSIKNDRDWLCIDDICVDEKYRKQGIGRQLVEFALQLAGNKGLDSVELNVYSDNIGAVHFYKKLGFKPQKYVMEIDNSVKNSDEEVQYHKRSV